MTMFFGANGTRLCKLVLLFGWCFTLSLLFHGKAHASPLYVCVGVCTPIIITDPSAPPPVQGNLVNILNVPVGLSVYDVAFVDGTFNGIFGTSPTFAFTSGDGAMQAAQALSSTLVDDGVTFFDSVPSLTRGCANDQACVVMTPFELFLGDFGFRHVAFTNDNPSLPGGEDLIGDPSGLVESRSQDFSEGGIFDARTFAVWRAAGGTAGDPINRFFIPPLYGDVVAEIPEPSTVHLTFIAILFSLLTGKFTHLRKSSAGRTGA